MCDGCERTSWGRPVRINFTFICYSRPCEQKYDPLRILRTIWIRCSHLTQVCGNSSKEKEVLFAMNLLWAMMLTMHMYPCCPTFSFCFGFVFFSLFINLFIYLFGKCKVFMSLVCLFTAVNKEAVNSIMHGSVICVWDLFVRKLLFSDWSNLQKCSSNSIKL